MIVSAGFFLVQDSVVFVSFAVQPQTIYYEIAETNLLSYGGINIYACIV
jgi:hypothetical protein